MGFQLNLKQEACVCLLFTHLAISKAHPRRWDFLVLLFLSYTFSFNPLMYHFIIFSMASEFHDGLLITFTLRTSHYLLFSHYLPFFHIPSSFYLSRHFLVYSSLSDILLNHSNSVLKSQQYEHGRQRVKQVCERRGDNERILVNERSEESPRWIKKKPPKPHDQ